MVTTWKLTKATKRTPAMFFRALGLLCQNKPNNIFRNKPVTGANLKLNNNFTFNAHGSIFISAKKERLLKCYNLRGREGFLLLFPKKVNQ